MIVSSFFATVAGICTSIAYLPQVIKTYRTKSVKGLSLFWLCYILLGGLLWFTYGVLVWDYYLMIADMIVVILSLCLLVMKLKYA